MRLDPSHHQPNRMSISGHQATHNVQMLLHLYAQCEPSGVATMVCAPLCDSVRWNGPRSLVLRTHKYSPGISLFPQYHLLLIPLSLSAILLMNTRNKNKSTHPGIPDMTPLQLSSTGLSRGPITRRPPNKKLTKDQQIAALKDKLRASQEIISSVTYFPSHCMYTTLTSSFIF